MSAHQVEAPHLVHALLKGIKKMHWGDIFTIVILMMTVGWFAYGHIDHRFERIENILERIERDNRDFHGRLAYIEGKLEKK